MQPCCSWLHPHMGTVSAHIAFLHPSDAAQQQWLKPCAYCSQQYCPVNNQWEAQLSSTVAVHCCLKTCACKQRHCCSDTTAEISLVFSHPLDFADRTLQHCCSASQPEILLPAAAMATAGSMAALVKQFLGQPCLWLH